jgi:hypothetical protein
MFSFGYFGVRSHFLPEPIWTVILPFYLSSCRWADRHTLPHQTFFHRREVAQTFFFPGMAWNCDPPDHTPK